MATRYHAYSEQQLCTSLSKGDQVALSEIYERFWEKLFAVAYNRTQSQHDAEEVVQDVLQRLWSLRKSLTIDKDGDLAAYLTVAVCNRVFNIRLKRHRERVRESNYRPVEDLPLSPEQILVANELQGRIEQLINGLPEHCRIVFRLKREEGLTNKEIAAQLGISENTVKFHLKKATKEIRDNLGVTIFFLLFIL